MSIDRRMDEEDVVMAQEQRHSNIPKFNYRIAELFPSFTAMVISTGLPWVAAKRTMRHRL